MDLDIPWVILGHSERRALVGESSEVRQLLSLTLPPILHELVPRCRSSAHMQPGMPARLAPQLWAAL